MKLERNWTQEVRAGETQEQSLSRDLWGFSGMGFKVIRDSRIKAQKLMERPRRKPPFSHTWNMGGEAHFSVLEKHLACLESSLPHFNCYGALEILAGRGGGFLVYPIEAWLEYYGDCSREIKTYQPSWPQQTWVKQSLLTAETPRKGRDTALSERAAQQLR